MKIKIFVITLLLAVVLVACSGGSTNEESSSIKGEVQNIKELVHDYSVGNIENQSASITSHQLIVTDSDENKLTYNLPEDEFFVSIAPYVDVTHR